MLFWLNFFPKCDFNDKNVYKNNPSNFKIWGVEFDIRISGGLLNLFPAETTVIDNLIIQNCTQ